MKESITQEFDYGCGIACYAFVLNIRYQVAESMLGEEQARSDRFWVKDLRDALVRAGHAYQSRYVKPRIKRYIYNEGTIVLIHRSKRYPSGHYLVRHNGYWMDPWINLSQNKDISQARSGYRKRLPGSPMYAILPAVALDSF